MMDGKNRKVLDWDELLEPWEDCSRDCEIVRVFGVDFVRHGKKTSWIVLNDESLSPGNKVRALELMKNGNFGSLHDMEQFIDRLLCLNGEGKWDVPENDELFRMLDLVFHAYRVQRIGGRS